MRLRHFTVALCTSLSLASAFAAPAAMAEDPGPKYRAQTIDFPRHCILHSFSPDLRRLAGRCLVDSKVVSLLQVDGKPVEPPLVADGVTYSNPSFEAMNDAGWIVGRVDHPNPDNPALRERVARWSPDGEFTVINLFNEERAPRPVGFGVEAVDSRGNALVSRRVTTKTQSFYWEADGELTKLPLMEGDTPTTHGVSMSETGVVVGHQAPTSKKHPKLQSFGFRWSKDSGTTQLPRIEGEQASGAAAISPKGEHIRGWTRTATAHFDTRPIAFDGGKPMPLPVPKGYETWMVNHVDDDATTVGFAYARESKPRCLVVSVGARSDCIDPVSVGVDEGWQFNEAAGFAPDGRIVVDASKAEFDRLHVLLVPRSR